MDELNELETYNGDTEHDMWVNYTYQENTDELPDLFGDTNMDDYINNLYNWD